HQRIAPAVVESDQGRARRQGGLAGDGHFEFAHTDQAVMLADEVQTPAEAFDAEGEFLLRGGIGGALARQYAVEHEDRQRIGIVAPVRPGEEAAGVSEGSEGGFDVIQGHAYTSTDSVMPRVLPGSR